MKPQFITTESARKDQLNAMGAWIAPTLPSISAINQMDTEALKALWADISMPSRKSPLAYETAKGKEAAAIKRVFNAVVKKLSV